MGGSIRFYCLRLDINLSSFCRAFSHPAAWRKVRRNICKQVRLRTISPKGIVQFWSCNKAVANVFPHKAEPSSATRTGQYLLDCYYLVALSSLLADESVDIRVELSNPLFVQCHSTFGRKK